MTVLRWIRKIEEEAKVSKQAASGDSDLPPPRKRASSLRSPQQSGAEVNQLRAKLRSLEQELETANFKALYYSTLVRVAKHELGVDIEKKSVTKPSGLC
jgi:ribosomal protein S10